MRVASAGGMNRTRQPFAIAVVLAFSTAATSCATKSETGAAVGATAGGAVGLAAGGTSGLLIGAALGGLFGYGAGRQIEREDQRRMAAALDQNRPVTWTNPHTGVVYVLQPTQSFTQRGQPCRNFHLEGDLERNEQNYVGTACRQPDGSWQIIGTLSRAP